MTLTAVILTKNEERHIGRALATLAGIADRCVIVDCGSTDQTVRIAEASGATVLENPWVNYATQFNWALEQLPADTQWVLRLDADELVSASLAVEMKSFLTEPQSVVQGVYIPRRMHFLGRPIRWGGVFPVHVLRLFKHKHGRSENRWMDEHVIVDGDTTAFSGEIIDDNLNTLTWWIDKHNSYATREVVDLLNLKYGFMRHETVADLRGGQQSGVKRWLKEKIYVRLPSGWRAFAYFCYRYFIRLGFLDGKEGTAFHVLQGFWYRYLVDLKYSEVTSYMKKHDADATTAIKAVLDIDLNARGS